MENKQTAVDYTVDKLFELFFDLTKNVDNYTDEIFKAKRLEIITTAKQIEIREQALFLRWLLKHYSTHTTEDGFVCYVDSMGKETDIKNIINHYNNGN